MQFWQALSIIAIVSAMFSLIIISRKKSAVRLLDAISKYASMWFDLLKWLFMIGAVTFVAEINENLVLQIIAGLSYAALYFYILSKILNMIYSKKFEQIYAGWDKFLIFIGRRPFVSGRGYNQEPMFIDEAMKKISIIAQMYSIIKKTVSSFNEDFPNENLSYFKKRDITFDKVTGKMMEILIHVNYYNKLLIILLVLLLVTFSFYTSIKELVIQLQNASQIH
jgi:hypothetical protein